MLEKHLNVKYAKIQPNTNAKNATNKYVICSVPYKIKIQTMRHIGYSNLGTKDVHLLSALLAQNVIEVLKAEKS